MTDTSAGWEHELLARAAREMTYPEMPSLVPGVLARLELQPTPTSVAERRRPWSWVTAAVVVVAIIAAGTIAFSSAARDAVADLFGFAVENERIEFLPTAAADATPTPFPRALQPGEYATPVSAAEAAAQLPFAIEVVPSAGEPHGYYLVDFLDRHVVILDYPEFQLWEADAVVFEKGLVFSKQVHVLEELAIRGQPAYWIDGGGHIVRVVDGNGDEVTGSLRTVEGKTLVWRSANRNYRLETMTLTKEKAVAIAESLP